MSTSGADYMALDISCDARTLAEERIGQFRMVEERAR